LEERFEVVENYFSSSLMIEEGETPRALAILKMVVSDG
jgi:hypothetical protein